MVLPGFFSAPGVTEDPGIVLGLFGSRAMPVAWETCGGCKGTQASKCSKTLNPNPTP